MDEQLIGSNEAIKTKVKRRVCTAQCDKTEADLMNITLVQTPQFKLEKSLITQNLKNIKCIGMNGLNIS